MLEMSHTGAETFHFLGATLNPDSAVTWLVVAALTVTAAYATRLSLRQLRRAWTAANQTSAEGME